MNNWKDLKGYAEFREILLDKAFTIKQESDEGLYCTRKITSNKVETHGVITKSFVQIKTYMVCLNQDGFRVNANIKTPGDIRQLEEKRTVEVINESMFVEILEILNKLI